jgi:hypothetical protein
MGGAAGGPGVHQALKRDNVLAVAPTVLELLPPTPHRNDHDHSPISNREPALPFHAGLGTSPP